jgi:hypothetical protein
MNGESTTVRIGDREVAIEQAETWVREYTKGDRTLQRPYAFPAYDHYQRDSDMDHLSDADLLAPMLLNVSMSVRAFYDLKSIATRLESGLMAIDRDLTLEAATDDEITRRVAALYSVMDDGTEKPRDVGVTRLSKILHRKRPQFLVLHDRRVRTCYRERIGWPQDDRLWGQYMVDLSLAVARDLRSQRSSFDRLAASVGAEGPVSRVRLLDIVAWNEGKMDEAAPAPADE